MRTCLALNFMYGWKSIWGLQLYVESLVMVQIIKNEDLEELRELGSGTFGTVYHGKWRGTDVAIKRIKKSCFTGRSSEQERLVFYFFLNYSWCLFELSVCIAFLFCCPATDVIELLSWSIAMRKLSCYGQFLLRHVYLKPGRVRVCQITSLMQWRAWGHPFYPKQEGFYCGHTISLPTLKMQKANSFSLI